MKQSQQYLALLNHLLTLLEGAPPLTWETYHPKISSSIEKEDGSSLLNLRIKQVGRDLCRSPAQTPAQSKANSEVRPWFSEPCSVDLQVPYLQRCKCHKLFGLLFQCSSTLKPNFWNFSCWILWTLPLFPFSMFPLERLDLSVISATCFGRMSTVRPSLPQHCSLGSCSHISSSSPWPAT